MPSTATKLEHRVTVLERELRKMRSELKAVQKCPDGRGGNGSPEDSKTARSSTRLSRPVTRIAGPRLPLRDNGYFGYRSSQGYPTPKPAAHRFAPLFRKNPHPRKIDGRRVYGNTSILSCVIEISFDPANRAVSMSVHSEVRISKRRGLLQLPTATWSTCGGAPKSRDRS